MTHRSDARAAGGALAAAALAAALLTAGCGGENAGGAGRGGGDGAGEAAGSPSPSPSETAQNSDPGAPEGIEGARAALQAFLRGQADGNPAVCRYVAQGGAFVRGPALRGDCPAGVRNTPHWLRPRERQALRTVSVRGGRLAGGKAVIPFSALHWTSGTMSESTLQSEFTLRRHEGLWQIVK
ncbi:hypothetical protein [Actinomadura sp. WMMA1423]|uniref:hypothetical protein n=1 Tax=Actinomadura sp. WMMA1423 TaxID=2591108 RepID=UPI0011479DC0|nr:hypothetical protein [Actinomadura sp. WMMA1423]